MNVMITVEFVMMSIAFYLFCLTYIRYANKFTLMSIYEKNELINDCLNP